MPRYGVIVIGGGHAGVEAAWAAANLLPASRGAGGAVEPTVALVTLDPATIGVMSCNPAIGGLAKGQLVREIDALGGLMGLAADASGIMFKVLNTSRGGAVHGPRAQCDKHEYAAAVRRLVASRPEIQVIAGSAEDLVVGHAGVEGVVLGEPRAGVAPGVRRARPGETIHARAVVLTTGTFMRGLMHTGDDTREGGRFGEGAAVGISRSLAALGFELARLKTGTPPRLDRGSIDWDSLPVQAGDDPPTPFSDLSGAGADESAAPSVGRFPVLGQVTCRLTATNEAIHGAIRANLHRAPMYSGQITSAGPRYCPSIEDKVVRFADKPSHQVFLEPESHRDAWVYCNGISTSLPPDVQESIVRGLAGCGGARILRYGYAVEYDMCPPHQILATGQTRRVAGLYLAGQINGTSGYEEAAGQGLVAGINAARMAAGLGEFVPGRDEAYLGVMMDDLVCKTPKEPYRMFTSRAEHRLTLRADNAADRLTPRADGLGLLATTDLGRLRRRVFDRRRVELAAVQREMGRARVGGVAVADLVRRPEFTAGHLRDALRGAAGVSGVGPGVWTTAHAEGRYAAYIARDKAEMRRRADLEHRPIPPGADFSAMVSLRTEARQALEKFRPRTFGQAGRLEGLTPADMTLLAVLLTAPGRRA